MSYSFAKFNLYRKDVALRNYIHDLYTILLESLDTLISILLRQYDEKCEYDHFGQEYQQLIQFGRVQLQQSEKAAPTG
jgi:hypothetical protein